MALRYSFGDSSSASIRLGVLAGVFRPATHALLAGFPPAVRRQVIDLGCGPGHTTELLAGVFPEADVIGVDTSPRFVDEARARGAARCRYAAPDVTETTVPDAPADVVYARF